MGWTSGFELDDGCQAAEMKDVSRSSGSASATRGASGIASHTRTHTRRRVVSVVHAWHTPACRVRSGCIPTVLEGTHSHCSRRPAAGGRRPSMVLRAAGCRSMTPLDWSTWNLQQNIGASLDPLPYEYDVSALQNSSFFLSKKRLTAFHGVFSTFFGVYEKCTIRKVLI